MTDRVEALIRTAEAEVAATLRVGAMPMARDDGPTTASTHAAIELDPRDRVIALLQLLYELMLGMIPLMQLSRFVMDVRMARARQDAAVGHAFPREGWLASRTAGLGPECGLAHQALAVVNLGLRAVERGLWLAANELPDRRQLPCGGAHGCRDFRRSPAAETGPDD